MGPTGGGSRTRCVPSEVPAVNLAREREAEYAGKRIYVRYELDYARTVGPLNSSLRPPFLSRSLLALAVAMEEVGRM